MARPAEDDRQAFSRILPILLTEEKGPTRKRDDRAAGRLDQEDDDPTLIFMPMRMAMIVRIRLNT